MGAPHVFQQEKSSAGQAERSARAQGQPARQGAVAGEEEKAGRLLAATCRHLSPPHLAQSFRAGASGGGRVVRINHSVVVARGRAVARVSGQRWRLALAALASLACPSLGARCRGGRVGQVVGVVQNGIGCGGSQARGGVGARGWMVRQGCRWAAAPDPPPPSQTPPARPPAHLCTPPRGRSSCGWSRSSTTSASTPPGPGTWWATWRRRWLQARGSVVAVRAAGQATSRPAHCWEAVGRHPAGLFETSCWAPFHECGRRGGRLGCRMQQELGACRRCWRRAGEAGPTASPGAATALISPTGSGRTRRSNGRGPRNCPPSARPGHASRHGSLRRTGQHLFRALGLALERGHFGCCAARQSWGLADRGAAVSAGARV